MLSKDNRRESGILLHITSLPGKYGIGTLGQEAYRFIDFLCDSRQRYWQLLPLNPIGSGNSPYQSPSCFAGEPLLIDLDFLVRDGLLSPDDLPQGPFSERLDYSAVRRYKLPLLKKAAAAFNPHRSDYLRFLRKNEGWLNDFALFMAIADASGGCRLSLFEEGLRYRLPAALSAFRRDHGEELQFYKITQYLFYCQYFVLKRYAAKKGVRLIGDIPFYVSLDSVDVWKEPDNFRLGRDLTPVRVAGVPPDRFSADGQLWGNPVYDWDFQKKTNYAWWRRRFAHCAQLFDVLRIDHFRAFASYYSIPFGAADARGGVWEKGPGLPFFKSVGSVLDELQVIAEDLGGEEPDVQALVQATGFPNMKVLQFAFDSDLQNGFLPRNFDRSCVCYTGTHDNDTALGWYGTATGRQRILFARLTPGAELAAPLRLILFGMRSKAWLMMVPMQDWLCLDTQARMNTPGTAAGNWEWRLPDGALDETLRDTIRRFTKGRNL